MAQPLPFKLLTLSLKESHVSGGEMKSHKFLNKSVFESFPDIGVSLERR